MRYLCLVRRSASSESADAIDAARQVLLEELDRGGQLVAASALAPATAGVLVRARAGQVSIAVGKPTGDGEVDAFFIVEARDLNEAIQLAARDPGARYGLVEVRPFRSIG